MAGDLHPSSTHPPLPPTTEDIRFDHLRLLRSPRIGPSSYHRLIAEHGSARAALGALPQIAAAAGLDSYAPCPEPLIVSELKTARRLGATLLLHGHDGYPDALTEIDDAPPALWAIGRLELLERPCLALVGARNASSLGLRTATAIARDLAAAGFTVVAGLAPGIAAAAHLAAQAGGTVAVQAGGIDQSPPNETAALAREIARNGLRLSAQPLGTEPRARHLPARSRLISGLGRVCLLVEAALKSGSAGTARDAADMGREILAVPGHPFDTRAAGCNALIRDGATLVRGAADVIEALRPLALPSLEKLADGDPVTDRLSETGLPTVPPEGAHPTHRDVLNRLGPTPTALDQLARALQSRPDDLGCVLAELEMSGQVRRHSGGLFSLRG